MGAIVGANVGIKVGAVVGTAVGFTVGAKVGIKVGAAVGFKVGATVGSDDGARVGTWVGESVGQSSQSIGQVLPRPRPTGLSPQMSSLVNMPVAQNSTGSGLSPQGVGARVGGIVLCSCRAW